MNNAYLLASIALCLTGCTSDSGPAESAASAPGPERPAPLFVALPADRSGISLVNTVPEDEERNHYNYEYIYNGGGVAVGDINNDGLADLYFTGNQVPDRLYLNKGELRFEDATDSALPKEEFHGWHAGVTMADVNSDGWLDIYVCRSGWYRDPAMRTNLLYMNKGDGTFTEEAAERGLADTTRSTQALFFDHDLDGDLDVYVVNEPLQTKSKLSLSQVHALVAQYRSASGRLYRNDKGHFTDITIAAGLWNLGYGLGAIASDLDHDGRTDLFVANDYLERDFLFMHQKNGTYRDEVLDRMRHISTYSMGCDAADYDNDGYTDLVVLDMVSEDHVRSKTNMGAMNPEKFWASVQGGLHHQYMFNMLHHNNGNGTFSDLGQLAGISKTDWSWAPLFADLDNDGWKDLVVTNGYKRDTRNNDFSQAMKELAKEGPITVDKMLELVPSTKIRNYLFRNNGDLTFDNVSEKWGFKDPVNSNGAAYADLDNDGDLDLAINNMEDVSQIYENTAMQQGLGHYLRIKLEGSAAVSPMNAKAELTTASGKQYLEFMPTRGYQSSVEHMLHFGLGKAEQAERLRITWMDGKVNELTAVAADQVITVRHADARSGAKEHLQRPLLTEVNGAGGLNFVHKENTYDDFAVQVLMPQKRSEEGPLMSTADVNGDGKQDLFIGGGRGQGGTLFLANSDGRFHRAAQQPWSMHKDREDQGSIFFDADGDGDQDLLVLSGSNEVDMAVDQFHPRLYRNDGNGGFTYDLAALPPFATCALRAAAGDTDGDGDMDLFIGGRLVPGEYPRAPRSYLLVNDGSGRFSDLTQERASHLISAGMFTDALFLDVDADKDLDLVTVGDWMPIAVHHNRSGTFAPSTTPDGLENTEGWWNRLISADLDGDGDQDLVCGNIGWNSKFHGTLETPLHLYSNDFDDNGKADIVLAKSKGEKLLPVRGRECSSQQCPKILDQFPTYDAFAHASLEQIYGPGKLDGGQHLQAKHMRSCIAWNEGGGKFQVQDLPSLAQAGPLNGLAAFDVNNDGHLDLMGAGNQWGAEVETIRYDGGTGIVLLGDGKRTFTPMSVVGSGLFAWGHVKDLRVLPSGPDGRPWIVVANNNDAMQVFRAAPPEGLLGQR